MRIAIDTGGTFTDCVFARDGRLEIIKVPSTPQNPAQAIDEALHKILAAADSRNTAIDKPKASTPAALELICGTTVGTNALLERRGGRVALVTTAGFEDVIEIGRQARPRLYDFFVTRPEPLVPRDRRLGLRERVRADGRVLLRPSEADMAHILRSVESTRADAVAICFLFSFTNPAHEKAIARRLRARGFSVSASHEILPEFREFERTATTVVNAYLVPVMGRYLEEVERIARAAAPARHGKASAVRVMQSSGGIISGAVAAREPVRTVLSGPAGGVLGARDVAQLAGYDRVISFDMGGTSTDVSLVEGELRTTNESAVAELPVAVPVLDIHTVGAGGGSIARFDRAGALRVGPESAGAEPGPICYGRGTQPTVTDAHLILGRIAPEGLLGGKFSLDEARTRLWMDRNRGPMRSVEEFSLGIIAVANATMEKAIRVISIERGYDPRGYTLVAFGGAGGLHACELAAALSIPRVLVPQFPGALSALGILRADVVKDFSQTLRLQAPLGGSSESKLPGRKEVQSALHRAFARLEQRGRKDMAAEAFASGRTTTQRLLDLRYVGQGYELTVPAAGNFVAAFHRAHERRYGYADPARPVEIVNVRARFIGEIAKPELPRSRLATADARAAIVGQRPVFWGSVALHLGGQKTPKAFSSGQHGRALPALMYDRAKLRPGNRFAGPAVVVEYSATTALPPGWRASVDPYQNLVLEPEER